MKTKPNFTYKEFIQKISNVQINKKDKPDNKSPRVLKSQGKNIPNSHVIYQDKLFQKRTIKKQQSLTKSSTPLLSSRKVQTKQNFLELTSSNVPKASTNLKNTTNKKLKLKNNLSISQQSSKKPSVKHSKSIVEQVRGNFYHNQSGLCEERHNESCSTFFKNYNFQNQQQNYHKKSITLSKSPSMSSKLSSRKHSTSGIDGKLKVLPKSNLTDRNIQRVTTQYYEQNRRPSERVNTQYEKTDSNCNRLSPSFYKLSADESSFLEFEEDRTHKNLFPESSTSRSKKSLVPLSSQYHKVKINGKSYEHVYNKFISKISQTLFQITKIDNQNQLLQHKIKYIQFLECLKELKMIRSDYEPYSQTQEIDLVKELWEELIMGYNINHFIIIVALILNITPLQNIKSQNSAEFQNYIYIQKKYQQFRFTRLQLDKSKVYSQKDSIQYHNFPFKPTISKTSDQIASLSKSQKKYKFNASLTHNQSVNLISRQQNVSINTQFEYPNQSLTQRSTSPLGNKRSEILYRQAKKKSLQKRQNKSTLDYEYERNKQELTFKPKITIKRKKINSDQMPNEYVSPRFALDEEKTINRLIRGRVQKQVKQLTIDKGLPYNDKMVQRLRRQKFEEIIKEQQQSRLKHCQNQSKVNLMTSQIHKIFKNQKSHQENKEQLNCHNRCTTQVQQLQSIHNLSFQDYSNTQNQRTNDEQCSMKRIENSPRGNSTSFTNKKCQESGQIEQKQNASDDFFALDIYFEQNRSDKLMIRRESTFEQVVEEAERFVLKHNLPSQMSRKLKQELMIAMKFHDVQKIQENAEEEECSLLG